MIDFLIFIFTRQRASYHDGIACTSDDPRTRRTRVRQKWEARKLRRQISEPRVPIGAQVDYDPRHYQFKRRMD